MDWDLYRRCRHGNIDRLHATAADPRDLVPQGRGARARGPGRLDDLGGAVTWLAVAIGGAIGSMARYGVGLLVQERFSPARFPVATAAVNLAGCFVIGLLAGLNASDRMTLRVPAREFVFVGLLGGFTTFSAFGLETLTLLRGNAPGVAVANIALQVIGGLVLAWIGYSLGARQG